MTGCLLATLVSDGVFSLGTLIGAVAVLALSLRTGVTTIRHCERLQWAQGPDFDESIGRRGALDRMAPVLTTAVVVVAAMLPFALSSGAAGQEIVQPMAAAVIGGVIVSALLNLFVVPALYVGLGSTAAPDAATTTDAVITLPEVETASER